MAEEVGFNYVGEERKDPSNVIDYNINSEQTKDLFAEINANNQTTTGMATVIPGINAPKLRAATSIVGGAGGGAVQYAEITLNRDSTIPQSEYYSFNVMTITGDNFVSQDPNDARQIFIEPGTYIAFVYVKVRNSARTFYYSLTYDDLNGNTTQLLDIADNTYTMSQTTIFEITTTGGCLRSGIRPDNGNVTNLSGSILKLMKLR